MEKLILFIEELWGYYCNEGEDTSDHFDYMFNSKKKLEEIIQKSENFDDGEIVKNIYRNSKIREDAVNTKVLNIVKTLESNISVNPYDIDYADLENLSILDIIKEYTDNIISSLHDLQEKDFEKLLKNEENTWKFKYESLKNKLENVLLLENLEDNFISVESSNIDAVAYENNNLYVKFKKGTVYSYNEVPENIFNELLESESKGKYINNTIKGNYEYNQCS